MARRAQTTIGVDTGGTFTDLVLVHEGETVAAKVHSTPQDPSRAVLDGLERLEPASLGPAVRVVHGTTVALNAMLQGRTSRAAFVTNEGFLDLIEIGRQDRPELYALHPRKPRSLVPRELRFEIAQRSAPDRSRPGTLERLATPSAKDLTRLARELAAARPESIAIGLLHSYADPSIERSIADALAAHTDLPITCSAELLPEYREYERFSTAVANAALVPVLQRYLERLMADLGDRRLEVLQSSGGTLPAERAALEPVRVLFSGPAGGVVGAARAAREAGFDELVALDMGGTSTDVAFQGASGGGLVDARSGALAGRVAGHPIAVPTLDIHTIGTGGGSLVRADRKRLLVGPESAGADPGPVAYGRGEVLTVTDAHVALGHLATGSFVDGALELDHARVERHLRELAAQLGATPERAARAVLDVARAAMRRAIGVMTMQRGKDPASLPLVAFGGAGGLHAAALADSLGMLGALVPRLPGCLSAWGMACAPPQHDAAATILRPLDALGARERRARMLELERASTRGLLASGARRGELQVERVLDLRYAGQTWVLALEDPGGAPAAVAAAFHTLHEARYGWSMHERPIELVALRVRVRGTDARPLPSRPRARAAPRRVFTGSRAVVFAESGPARANVVSRELLPEGARFEGPAVVEEFSGTTLVPPGWRAEVRAGGHLWLERATERTPARRR